MVNAGEGKLREPQWGNVLHGNAFQGKELSPQGEKKESFLGFKNKMGKRAIIPGTVVMSEGSAIIKHTGTQEKWAFFQPH